MKENNNNLIPLYNILNGGLVASAIILISIAIGMGTAIPSMAIHDNSAEVDKENNVCKFVTSFEEKDGVTRVLGITKEVQIVTTKNGNENIKCKFSLDKNTLKITGSDIDKAHHLKVRAQIFDIDDSTNSLINDCNVIITPNADANLSCHFKK